MMSCILVKNGSRVLECCMASYRTAIHILHLEARAMRQICEFYGKVHSVSAYPITVRQLAASLSDALGARVRMRI